MKVYWKYTYPQATQEADEFVFHRYRFGEMYHYITYSSTDPLQWMGAVRMRVQTADKNITIIRKWSAQLQSIS